VATRTTLLGAPPTEEDLAARAAADERFDKWHIVAIEGWLEGYQAGQVSFHSMCLGILEAAEVVGLSEVATQRGLGFAVSQALRNPPAKEGRSNSFPEKILQAAAGLALIVHEREGLSLKASRHEPARGSAFARVAEILGSVRNFKERTAEDAWKKFGGIWKARRASTANSNKGGSN
jgi:hypothetical protein